MTAVESEDWLDLSHHNTVTDWGKIAKKYKGVILKATQGNSYVDPTFKTRYAAAKKAGLKVSAYHFGDFQNEADARREAQHVVDTVKGCDLYNNEIVIDLETDKYNLDKHTLTGCLMEFAKTVGRADYKAIAYTYPSFLKTQLEPFNLPLWLADYSDGSKYYEDLKDAFNIVMLQFSDKGHPAGTSGNVDLDRRFVFKPKGDQKPMAEDRSKLPVSDWAKNDVEEAVKLGITKQADRPQDYATRQEVIIMDLRTYEAATRFADWQYELMAGDLDKYAPYLNNLEEWQDKLKNKTAAVADIVFLLFAAGARRMEGGK